MLHSNRMIVMISPITFSQCKLSLIFLMKRNFFHLNNERLIIQLSRSNRNYNVEVNHMKVRKCRFFKARFSTRYNPIKRKKLKIVKCCHRRFLFPNKKYTQAKKIVTTGPSCWFKYHKNQVI
jgi:hypothetical protein